jgi:DNA-binding NarL/FixJ family response regulator
MCGNQLYSDQKEFCSRDCHNKHQALHKPSYEELLELRRLGKSNVKIAKQFDVAETTIRKWFKNYENKITT